MKPQHETIIEHLNDILTGELTAINQYFLHGAMCKDWGYMRLYEHSRHESIDEMKHAESLIERILFLEGVPNVQRLSKVRVGETVDEQFRADLALEMEAIPRLRAAIAHCLDIRDDGTRLLLEDILASEEEHVDWLESQLGLIEQLGLAGYLAQQIHAK